MAALHEIARQYAEKNPRRYSVGDYMENWPKLAR